MLSIYHIEGLSYNALIALNSNTSPKQLVDILAQLICL